MSGLADIRDRILLAKRALDAALELLGPDPATGPTCGIEVTDPWGRTARCSAPAVERKGGQAWCAEHRPA